MRTAPIGLVGLSLLSLLVACGSSSPAPVTSPAADAGPAPAAAPPQRAWSTTVPLSTKNELGATKLGTPVLTDDGRVLVAGGMATDNDAPVAGLDLTGLFAFTIDASGKPTKPHELFAAAQPNADAMIFNAGAIDADGNAFFAGSIYSLGAGGLASSTVIGNDDPTGAAKGSSMLEGDLTAMTAMPLAGGDFALAGTFRAGVKLGATSLSAGAGNESVFVARVSANGSCAWAKSFDAVPDKVVLAKADDGDVFVAFDASPQGEGTVHVRAARLASASGAIAWNVDLGGASPLENVLDGPFGIAAAGDALRVVMVPDSNRSSPDLTITTLAEADGAIRATLSVSLEGSDIQLGPMADDGAGGAYLTGVGWGAVLGGATLPPNGAFVAHVDATGAGTWADSYAAGNQIADAIVLGGSRLVIAGQGSVDAKVTASFFVTSYTLP